MKEYNKRLILLIIICVFTLCILFGALKMHQNKMNESLANSKIKDYLVEIKYEEIATHVIEQPSAIIYVSNSSEQKTLDFEKIFIPVVKKYNLENDFVYLNINNTNIGDFLYQNAPVFVFYKNGEVFDMLDVSTLKNEKDIVKILSERSVIVD